MKSLDTNVLVYAVSEHDGLKENAAKKLLEEALKGGWPIAAQVYGEFFSVMTRKKYMSRADARVAIQTFSELMPALASSVTAHSAALKLAAEKQMQYWDALIVAVCAENGVKKLYSEDLPGSVKPLGVHCIVPW
jgi:predicted nucleic acid-binding protein